MKLFVIFLTLFCSFTGARAQAQTADLSGIMSATYVTLMRPRAEVKALLPKDMDILAVDANFHPVIVLVGRQDAVVKLVASPYCPPLLPCAYNEAAVYIPHVTHSKYPGKLFGYMPELFLDQTAPIIIGRQDYGYKKDPAYIANLGFSYLINDIDGTEVLNLAISDVLNPDVPQMYKNLALLKDVFAQAGITEKKGIVSCVNMSIDLSKTTFLPKSVHGTFAGTTTIPMKTAIDTVGLDQSVFGSFQLVGPWLHTAKYDCALAP